MFRSLKNAANGIRFIVILSKNVVHLSTQTLITTIF